MRKVLLTIRPLAILKHDAGEAAQARRLCYVIFRPVAQRLACGKIHRWADITHKRDACATLCFGP